MPPSQKAPLHKHQYIHVNTLRLKEMKEYFRYLSSFRSIFWRNFLAGTAQGLGFILGTVVVLTVTAYILGHVLSGLPWLGEFFGNLNFWLQQNVDKYQQS
ncbi:MAG: DUF5665 domain-containing protein [Candidatus Gracilibacteria bacterium]